ncbi:MAG: 8-oxoguanine deaminase, partial [Candidatus Cloacimonetes bacterium]|nr:8-oxoguanine deaminase [Candidatus Cloacimonadota bacterium]
GTLAPGMSADFIGFDLNRIEFAGGLSDPLGALVLCDAKQVDISVINGKMKVQKGKLLVKNLPELIKKQNKKAEELLQK